MTDIVREVLETRAELRRALGDEVADDEEDGDVEPEDELSDEEDIAAAKSEQEESEHQS